VTNRARRRRRSIRLRLTVLYSGVFSLTGLTLLGLTYLLFRRRIGHTGVMIVPKRDLPAATPGRLRSGQVGLLAQQLRDQALHQLLLVSVLMLFVMMLVSVVFGWWIAGRLLRPLHTITATARRLSGANLHERIGLDGPQDELKNLADTFDAMLDRLRDAFDSQRRFIAHASHELRTPLAIQRAAIQIRLGQAEPADLPRIQEELLQSNRRSERLIEGLLALATSERGLERRELVDLSEVVAEAVEQWRHRIQENGLRTELDLGALPVHGDPVLLFQLVGNLVQNAVRYNIPGGTVVLTTSEEGGLTVRNTGPVVPEAELDSLAEPFRRLVRDGEGAGLGLSIVRSIAQAHGAAVSLRARPSGGLDVQVRLATSADRGTVAA
jgi:signal transduction histidine kinase